MTVKPFFFDNNMFDDEDLASIDSEEAAEFTKSQMEIMQKEAFDKGKKAGVLESETSTNKNILTTLEKIDRDMSVLFAAEHDRGAKYEEEAINLVFVIMQKIFPLYMEEYGNKELKGIIENILNDHNTPEKIHIELSKNLLPDLQNSINEMEGSLKKHITLSENTSLQNHECRILWPDGGVICNHHIIANKTLSIIKETLAERGVNVHDKSIIINEVTSDENLEQSDDPGQNTQQEKLK